MSNADKAEERFNGGMNCAQSVLTVFGPSCGLDEEKCVRVAAAFGGGIGHLQEICGAVSGAVMVLGLKFGGDSASRDNRERINELAQRFIHEFSARNSSILCRDLLGFDISTKDGLLEARRRGVFSACAGYVRIASELLDTMLQP
jgi:C_GCAxxG_C_C family probable redox protein